MYKLINIKKINKHDDGYSVHNYYKFLDYAFEKSDFFMLVYVNYYGKGYSKKQKYYKEKLMPYKVKSRSNPSWPGTPYTFSKDSTYKIVFYKAEKCAKQIIMEAEAINDWTRPEMPEDIAFFVGNKCWFLSVGHENIATIVDPDKNDIDFLTENGFAQRGDILFVNNDISSLTESF